MQWQNTPNTDSFSGFPPVCDEEVPVFFLPLSGIDRHQGGGSLDVDGWVWPPALHAIRTTNFFLAINTAILQNYTGEWVRVRVKNMINHDCWIYVSATVCCKGWWWNGTPITLTVLTWGGRGVCLLSAVTLLGLGFAKKTHDRQPSCNMCISFQRFFFCK